ncbi:DUF624 domain-containing protein [Brachybacterium sp. DNPG3]
MNGPTRDDRSTMTRLTEAVLWLLVIGALLIVTTLPTTLTWMLLAQDASNIPLYAVSALFVPPALAAALFAWSRRAEDLDPVPAKVFLRGYRVNLRDALGIGAPALLLLAILATNVVGGSAVGTGALTPLFVVLAAILLLVAVRALSIASRLGFRLRDLARLSLFTLLTMPLRTLALLSFGVLVGGISLFVGDYAVALLGAPLSFALWWSEQPVISRLRRDFIEGADGADGADGSEGADGSSDSDGSGRAADGAAS